MIVSQLFEMEQSERTSDDYLTPAWVFEVMGLRFDLDVAAPPWDTHVPADRKFTKADNGLAQEWEGCVWMNPPFSNAAPWVRRFVEHGYGVALLPFSQSQWTIDLWNSGAAVAVPPKWFAFDNLTMVSMWFPVWFVAFGDECVEAISRLGKVR